jgi:choice-of-anchor C domain-containing protein
MTPHGLKSVFAIVAALTVAVPSAPANIIVNGSFETGTLPTPPGTTFVSGSTAIDGWLVGGHGIDYIGTYWQASDGGRSVDLDSGTVLGAGPYDGSIAQTFGTVSGQPYRVNFDMAGNPDGAPALKSLEVSAAGQSANLSFLNSSQTLSNMGYQPREFLFTANSSTTTLMFKSLSGTGYGAVIDNVSVIAVPEPASFLLGAFGAIALLSIRRR